MKIKLLSFSPNVTGKEIYGLELTAESQVDEDALRHFWRSGIKLNAITQRPNNDSSLQLTFADLIGR